MADEIKNLSDRFLFDTLVPPLVADLDTRGLLMAVVGGWQDRIADLRSTAARFPELLNPAPPAYSCVLVTYRAEPGGNIVPVTLDLTTTTPDDAADLAAWAAEQLDIDGTRIVSAVLGTDALREIGVDTVQFLAASLGAVLYPGLPGEDAAVVAARQTQALATYFPRLRIKGTPESFSAFARLAGFDAGSMTPLWTRLSPRAPGDIGLEANLPDFRARADFLPTGQLPDPEGVYVPLDFTDGPFYHWFSGSLTLGPTDATYYPTAVNGRNPFIALRVAGGPVAHPPLGHYTLTGGAFGRKAEVALAVGTDTSHLIAQALIDGGAYNGLRIAVAGSGSWREMSVEAQLSTLKYRSSYFDAALYKVSAGTRAVTVNPDLAADPTLVPDGTATAPFRAWSGGTNVTSQVTLWPARLITTTGNVRAREQAAGTLTEVDTSALTGAAQRVYDLAAEVRAATRFPRRAGVGELSRDNFQLAAFPCTAVLVVTTGTGSYGGIVNSMYRPVGGTYEASFGVERPPASFLGLTTQSVTAGTYSFLGAGISGSYFTATGTWYAGVTAGYTAGTLTGYWSEPSNDYIRTEPSATAKAAGTVCYTQMPEGSFYDAGSYATVWDDVPWLRPLRAGGEAVDADLFIPFDDPDPVIQTSMTARVLDKSGAYNRALVYDLPDVPLPPFTKLKPEELGAPVTLALAGSGTSLYPVVGVSPSLMVGEGVWNRGRYDDALLWWPLAEQPFQPLAPVPALGLPPTEVWLRPTDRIWDAQRGWALQMAAGGTVDRPDFGLPDHYSFAVTVKTSTGGTVVTDEPQVRVGAAELRFSPTAVALKVRGAGTASSLSIALTPEINTLVHVNVGPRASTLSLANAAGWTEPTPIEPAPALLGAVWTSRASANNSVAWSATVWGKGLFVAVGGSSIMTSPDGTTWTSRTSVVGGNWLALAFNGELFVAVGAGATSIMTSPDGLTWTARTAPASNFWTGVAWGDGGWVAVSLSGSHRVMTSPDGITWTARLAPAGGWTCVAYGNRRFIALANSETATMVSTDNGATWVSGAAPSADYWVSAAYGRGLFVGVAYGGPGTHVMTSPDGLVWTARTPSDAGNLWYGVTYGHGVFVAVAGSGSERVMLSFDGMTWTARTAAADLNWTAVCFGDYLFVAVANSGTGNRVMTSPVAIYPVAPGWTGARLARGHTTVQLHDFMVWSGERTTAQLEVLRAPRAVAAGTAGQRPYIEGVSSDRWALQMLPSGFVVPVGADACPEVYPLGEVRRYEGTGRYVGNAAYKQVGLGGAQTIPAAWALGAQGPAVPATGQVVVAGTWGEPGINAWWAGSYGTLYQVAPPYTALGGTTTATIVLSGTNNDVWPPALAQYNPASDRVYVKGDNSYAYEVRIDDLGDGPVFVASIPLRPRPARELPFIAENLQAGREVVSDFETALFTQDNALSVNTGGTVYSASYSNFGFLLTEDSEYLLTESEAALLLEGEFGTTPFFLYLNSRVKSGAANAFTRWVDPTSYGQGLGVAARETAGRLAFENTETLPAGNYRLAVDVGNIGTVDSQFTGFEVAVTLTTGVGEPLTFPAVLLPDGTGANPRDWTQVEFVLPYTVVGAWRLTFDWTNDRDVPSRGEYRRLAIYAYTVRRIASELHRIVAYPLQIVPVDVAAPPLAAGAYVASYNSYGTVISYAHEQNLYGATAGEDTFNNPRSPLADILTGSTLERKDRFDFLSPWVLPDASATAAPTAGTLNVAPVAAYHNVGDVVDLTHLGATGSGALRHTFHAWTAGTVSTWSGTLAQLTLNTGGTWPLSALVVDSLGRSAQATATLVVNTPPSIQLATASLTSAPVPYETRLSAIVADVEGDSFTTRWFRLPDTENVLTLIGTGTSIDYTVADTQQVRIYAIDSRGGTNFADLPLTGGPNAAPLASLVAIVPQKLKGYKFGLTQQRPPPTQTLRIAAVARDPENRGVSTEWTFWDGSTATGQTDRLSSFGGGTLCSVEQLIGLEADANIPTPEPGRRSFSLAVEDTDGNGSIVRGEVEFVQNQIPIITLCQVSSLSVQAGDRLFYAAQARDPDGDVLSYTWEFPAIGLTLYGPNVTIDTAQLAGRSIGGRLVVTDGYGGEATAEVPSAAVFSTGLQPLTIDPAGGVFTQGAVVTLGSSDLPNASVAIRYNLDGGLLPAVTSGLPYYGPVMLAHVPGLVVPFRARAFWTGTLATASSPLAEATFSFE